MPTVLVVDDSTVDRRLAGSHLEKSGMTVVFANNGSEALAVIQQRSPDLVLSDLQMGNMDGLQLVQEVRRRFPRIPVILMTAHGSEEIAVQALQKGAASYVPKRNIAQDLAATVESVLAVAQTARQQERLLDCWMSSESQYLIGNDLSLIPALIATLQENLARIKLCDETGLIRVAVALREAVNNAIYHGNLELTGPMSSLDAATVEARIKERRQQDAYRDRRVTLITEETRSEVVYVVQDDGPGFDVANLPDVHDPEAMQKLPGKGLMLIRTFMDEVSHNPAGNQITMIKRRDA